MATPLAASTLLAALRAEGCHVVEYKSWRTHNRNGKGAWGPVNGVMIHHTASSGEESSVALCYNGHATLPGPLCHTVGGKSGTLYMVGHGRANHAGSGDADVLRAVINESPLPVDNEANTDGNARFYGLEIVNLGNGKDQYPVVQYDAAVRWAAAICRTHGWGAESVIGHKEWQPGKIDPHGPVEGRGGFSMSRFRADVAERLKHPASWNPTQPSTPQPAPEEDDMALSDADMKKLADLVADRVWNRDGDIKVPWGTEQNPEWAAKSILTYDVEIARENRGRIKQLQAELGALSGVVSRLAEGGGLDAAEIQAAAEAGARAALDRLGEALTDEPA